MAKFIGALCPVVLQNGSICLGQLQLSDEADETGETKVRSRDDIAILYLRYMIWFDVKSAYGMVNLLKYIIRER